jgi:WD40 repeat protein
MVSDSVSKAGLGILLGGLLRSFGRGWTASRTLLSCLRVVWVSCTSVAVGGLVLVFAPQGQDLFLDVRGGYWAGTAFWTLFYLSFILVWVAPVYLSSLWMLSRVSPRTAETEDEQTLALRCKHGVPRGLAAGCVGLLLLGQLGALVEAPYLIDATTNTVRDPKHEIIVILAFLFVTFIIAVFVRHLFGRPGSLADVRAWRRNVYGLVLILVLLFVPLLLASTLQDFTEFVRSLLERIGNLIGNLLQGLVDRRMAEIILNIGAAVPLVIVASYLLTFLPWSWIRKPAVVILATAIVLTIVPLSIALATLLIVDLSTRLVPVARFELDAPLGIGHLAVLPVVTLLLGYATWRMLRPGSRVQEAIGRLLGRTVGQGTGWADGLRWLDVGFAGVLLVSLAIITFQFLYHPVDITEHIYRALLLPFLLGLLVPIFTFISYWSFRWQAPILLGGIIAVAFLAPDNADVRTTPQEFERPTLEHTVARWEKANACDRRSSDPSLKCPSPIIVSVAGGASRSAFLLAAVLGKLLDETQTESGEMLRPFETQLFAISGVSGGSLGASVTYAALADSVTRGNGGKRMLGPPPCRAMRDDTNWFAPHIPGSPMPEASWRACLELILAGDFLSPVMISLVSNDIFGIAPRGDRAAILESSWERRYTRFTGNTTLARPMTSVRAQALATNETTWLPMMVLAGTSVSTGRRILTTDVDTLLSAKLNDLRGRLFRDAYDLHELLAPSTGIASASFSPSGAEFLLSYYDNPKAQIWDTATGRIVRQLDLGEGRAVWSQDGEYIVSLSSYLYNDVNVFRAATGLRVRTLPAAGGAAPALSPKGDRLLTNTDGKLRVWDIATGERVVEIDHGIAGKGNAMFSRDGRSILSVRSDRALVIYDARTGQLEATLADFGYYDNFSLSPDRRFVFADRANEAGKSARVDELSGKRNFSVADHRIIVFSPDGDRLVYAPIRGGIRIRDIAAGTEIEVRHTASDSWLQPIFSGDGRRIMLWDGQGGARVIDAATGAELKVVRGQEGHVHDGVFHPSGVLALTMSDNGLSRLWNLGTGKEVYVIRGTKGGSGCAHCDVRLSTAATMSARFPVISPHGNIRGGRELADRVVDGGYFENFGALTALELADELRGSQFGLDPRIILINNEPAATGMSCLTRDSQIALPHPAAKITFGTVQSPIAALWATGTARGTHAAVDLCSRIGGGDKFAFVTVVQDKRTRDSSLSMSWWLSKHVQLYLDRQVDTQRTESNVDAFHIIQSWRTSAK